MKGLKLVIPSTIVAGLSTLLVFGVLQFGAPVNADTQYWGNTIGKTYGNSPGTYPCAGLGTTCTCNGGMWGQTDNPYYTDKSVNQWSDKIDENFWGIWGWVDGMTDWQDLPVGYGPVTAMRIYNDRCTRGASDHGVNFSYVGTTSDGF